MDENPYKSPRESGYLTPPPNVVPSWLKDRVTELALGLLVAVTVLPIVMAIIWSLDIH